MKEPRNTTSNNKRIEPYPSTRSSKKVEHHSSSDEEFEEDEVVDRRSATPESKLHSIANLAAAAASISAVSPANANTASDSSDHHHHHHHRSSPPAASSSPSSSSAGDDDKRSKKKLELTKEDLEKYFHMSQQHAAAKLGVSVSTLKRRFYEIFNNKRWPYHHAVHGPNSKQAKEARTRGQQQSQLPAIAPQRPSALLQQPAIVTPQSSSSSSPSPTAAAKVKSTSPVTTPSSNSSAHHARHHPQTQQQLPPPPPLTHSHAPSPVTAATPSFMVPLIKPKSVLASLATPSSSSMKQESHMIPRASVGVVPSPIFPTYKPSSPRQMAPHSALAAPSAHKPIRFFGTHEPSAPATCHDLDADCVEERILAEYEVALARPVAMYPNNHHHGSSSSSSSHAPPASSSSSAFQTRDGFSRPHLVEDKKPAVSPSPAFARFSTTNSHLATPTPTSRTPPVPSAPARNEAKFSLAYIMLEQDKDEKVIDKAALMEVFNWDERPAFVDVLPKDRYARYENFSVFPKSQQLSL